MKYNRVFLNLHRCGHCKKLAPDWEKLEKEFESSDIGFVGSVDCTAGGKPICESNGVQGYPTLKWGDPSALEDYQGGRSLKDLTNFSKENLKPICSVSNIDLCDDDKKAQITKYQAMAKDDLKTAIEEKEKEIEDAEKYFKTEVEKLQKSYEGLMETKESTIAEVKNSGLSLMKSVKKAGASEGSDEL
uniref:Thioredoxin domain-containing protein n=1 Tax=Corethron hystrix TaxID=216773 RepID=A0A7S1BQ10_9STRA|mmetsp:Transcript_35160/g.81293  ORF Transcript_35160/g.81293 Transcript_35160/m.81293 type:complete len:188 (+) Transcript_35160:446-1009(+)